MNDDIAHELAVKFPSAGQSPEFATLYTELRGTVPPATVERVERLIQMAELAAERAGYAEAWTLVDNIAEHFPGFGAAIRAVARHLLEDVRRDDCGVRRDERQPHTWVECRGAVPTGPDAAA